MKRTILIATLLLAACSPTAPGSTGAVSTVAAGVPSAYPASPDQAASARQAITLALQQIRSGRGVALTGDSYIDDGGTDIPAHLTGQIAPDGAMDLQISVQFSQGTDVFEVRSVAGHEYTWDPNTSSWNSAPLGEPAAGGVSTLDPLFMNYPAQVNADTLRIAPDDVVNGTATSVYEVSISSSDQNDRVTSRLWLDKNSSTLLQEGVSLNNQVELPDGLGFNGNFLLQFQPADSPVSISPPTTS